MKKILTQGRLAALIVLLVLVIDQVIKICVKTGMCTSISASPIGFIFILPKITEWLLEWSFFLSCS